MGDIRRVQVIPDQGVVKHPMAPGGEFAADEKALRELIGATEIFTAHGKYTLPLLVEHGTEQSERGRRGHVVGLMYLGDEGEGGPGLYADVQYTDEGVALRKSERYPYISPTLVWGYEDDRGTKHDLILVEISMVASPHLKLNQFVRGGECDPVESLILTEDLMSKKADAVVQAAEEPVPQVVEGGDEEDRIAVLEAKVQMILDKLESMTQPSEEAESQEEMPEEDEAEMKCKPAQMSDELVQLTQRLHKAEVALLQRDKADASKEVDVLISAGKVLPKAKDVLVRMRMEDPKGFAMLAQSLPTVDFGTIHGGDVAPDVAPQEDYHTAVAKLTAKLMADGKTYEDAHRVALSQLKED